MSHNKTKAESQPPVVDDEQGHGDESEPKHAVSAPVGRKIKYMGTADVKRILRKDTASSLLPPMPYDVLWDSRNGWTVDTSDHPHVAPEWWDFLIVNDSFEDVTDESAAPANRHQEMFLGIKGRKSEPDPGGSPVLS